VDPSASGARVEHEGELAILTLAAPPLNLFDDALLSTLEDALRELRRRPPRALLVRADGNVVSAGVDVHLFAGLSTDAAAALFRRLLAITHAVEALPFPTVFAAHGLCLTAAFELALACDLIFAAESARFGLVERVIGITPAMGGTQRLAERAGAARARELVLTGEHFDAATLNAWNVVNRVLPDEGFEKAVLDFAWTLAQGPTRAHHATKRIVAAYLDGGVSAADETVPEVAGALFETEDARDAIRSFLEHGPGKATFRGH
jgi:enoyl-CoA hydratase